ncbi:hypothetical protein CBL_07061 [Carabus blaptoides fortunei]
MTRWKVSRRRLDSIAKLKPVNCMKRDRVMFLPSVNNWRCQLLVSQSGIDKDRTLLHGACVALEFVGRHATLTGSPRAPTPSSTDSSGHRSLRPIVDNHLLFIH